MPIAVNLYQTRDAKTEAGDFLRAVQKQKQQYQGIWIVGADGKVLSGHQEHSEEVSKWTAEVLATIDAALAKAGPLTARNPGPKDVLPNWGKNVQKDGSVTLAIAARHFFQGKGIDKGAIDSVTLTKKDWQEFAPPEPAKGTSWRLPAKIGVEFRRCLSTVSDQSFMPKADEVTAVDFTGAVTRVTDGIANLSYTGRISSLHTHPFNKNYVYTAQAKLRGIGAYDVEKQEMVSLLWIFEGTSRDVRATSENGLAAVVEWQRDARLEAAAKR